MSDRHLSPDREAVFPNLRKEEYLVTSAEDPDYNYIAHAAGRSDAPWWPVGEGTEGVFWPPGVAREETLDSFISAFRTEGYEPCDGAEQEDEFEKVALYVGADGVPSHAARQLPSGAWSSKLGDWEDIEHKTLSCLEGSEENAPGYGKVAKFLKRKRSPQGQDRGPESAGAPASAERQKEDVGEKEQPPRPEPQPPA
jgi:hypothetical protein